MFKVYDLVIKNEDTWIPTDVDTFGRGVGMGIICEPLNPLPEDQVDVIWMGGGRCTEAVVQLKPAPTKHPPSP